MVKVKNQIPMSPTQLGEEIQRKFGLNKRPSPQKINQELFKAGLQTSKTIKKRGKQKKIWELTEVGEEYGLLERDTAPGHNKTVYCVRWYSSVIPLIENRFKPESI